MATSQPEFVDVHFPGDRPTASGPAAGRLAALLVCRGQLTASEKSRRRGPLMPVPRWHSLRPFLVGKAAPWPRFTPKLRTDADYPSKLCLSLRTTSEPLLLHRCMRCDIQPKKINEISCENHKRWAREVSNLQPSGMSE